MDNTVIEAGSTKTAEELATRWAALQSAVAAAASKEASESLSSASIADAFPSIHEIAGRAQKAGRMAAYILGGLIDPQAGFAEGCRNMPLDWWTLVATAVGSPAPSFGTIAATCCLLAIAEKARAEALYRDLKW